MAIITLGANAITALPASIPTGKVLQVQSSSITSTASSSTTSIVSFMNLSITPSSTSNKVFCIYQGTGYANGHNNTLLIRLYSCLLYTSPSPRDRQKSRMPSSA